MCSNERRREHLGVRLVGCAQATLNALRALRLDVPNAAALKEVRTHRGCLSVGGRVNGLATRLSVTTLAASLATCKSLVIQGLMSTSGKSTSPLVGEGRVGGREALLRRRRRALTSRPPPLRRLAPPRLEAAVHAGFAQRRARAGGVALARYRLNARAH